MQPNRFGIFFPAISFSLIFLAAGCGGSMGSKPAPLPAGGVFPIPLYAKGTMQDTIIGTDEASTTEFDSQSWWLDYSGSPEDVIAFYEKAIPDARVDRSPDDDPDAVAVIRWVPEGARQGERVEVVVSRDEIQIVETVQWGRRAKGLLD